MPATEGVSEASEASGEYGASGTVKLEGRVLIKAFELALKPGWTCLLGPSGSGKSTLLRLLAGLDTPAILQGQKSLPGRIGWMAQTDLMQPRLTVLQNVMLVEELAGRQPHKARAQELLVLVGLNGNQHSFPHMLSGGQRQRVALARTLMSDAELILLDEPFSALDPVNRALMQELAHQHFSGRTVLLVTHDPFEALRLGQQICMLSNQILQHIEPLAGPTPHSLSDPSLALAAANLLTRIREAA